MWHLGNRKEERNRAPESQSELLRLCEIHIAIELDKSQSIILPSTKPALPNNCQEYIYIIENQKRFCHP